MSVASVGIFPNTSESEKELKQRCDIIIWSSSWKRSWAYQLCNNYLLLRHWSSYSSFYLYLLTFIKLALEMTFALTYSELRLMSRCNVCSKAWQKLSKNNSEQIGHSLERELSGVLSKSVPPLYLFQTGLLSARSISKKKTKNSCFALDSSQAA